MHEPSRKPLCVRMLRAAAHQSNPGPSCPSPFNMAWQGRDETPSLVPCLWAPSPGCSANPAAPALLLCTVGLPARTGPAGQALPPPPCLLPPGRSSVQPCFAAGPFPEDLLNHIPIARGFPRMCFSCKPISSPSPPSDLPFVGGYCHPILHGSTFQLNRSSVLQEIWLAAPASRWWEALPLLPCWWEEALQPTVTAFGAAQLPQAALYPGEAFTARVNLPKLGSQIIQAKLFWQVKTLQNLGRDVAGVTGEALFYWYSRWWLHQPVPGTDPVGL